MTLTEFLLARIAEDEALHIANWDPARVLAECEAKRYIVNGWAELLDLDHGDKPWNPAVKGVAKHVAYIGLLQLAAIYSGHPDYDEGWRLAEPLGAP